MRTAVIVLLSGGSQLFCASTVFALPTGLFADTVANMITGEEEDDDDDSDGDDDDEGGKEDDASPSDDEQASGAPTNDSGDDDDDDDTNGAKPDDGAPDGNDDDPLLALGAHAPAQPQQQSNTTAPAQQLNTPAPPSPPATKLTPEQKAAKVLADQELAATEAEEWADEAKKPVRRKGASPTKGSSGEDGAVLQGTIISSPDSGKGSGSGIETVPADGEDSDDEEDEDAPDESDDSRRTWFYKLMWNQPKSRAGTIYEGLSLLYILISTLVMMIKTLPDIGGDTTFDVIEGIICGTFTIEYCIRIYAVESWPRYQKAENRICGSGRLGWAVYDFYAIIDLASILPFWIDLMTPGDIAATSFVRVLRLLKPGHFIEGVDQIYNVVIENKDVLISSGQIAMVVWCIFSSLMYETERHNADPENMDQFSNIRRSMWMTLLNLTGEYPIGTYTTAGKFVSLGICLFAFAIVAVPIGLLGDGLQDALEEELESDSEDNEAEAEDGEYEADEATWTGRMYNLLNSMNVLYFIFGLILFNTACLVVRTVKSVQDDDSAKTVLDVCEAISIVIYTVEYILRLASAHHDPDVRDNTDGRVVFWLPSNAPAWLLYMFSFYGLVDLVSIVPFYVDLAFDGGDFSDVAAVFRMIRLLRMEKIMPSFTFLDDAFRAKKKILVCTVYVMAVCTVFFATLLYYTEKNNDVEDAGKKMSHRFRSIIHSLFYTFIHLTGDYPLVQYTNAGRVVNFFMIVLAQAFVAIPAAVLIDAFQEIMIKNQKKQDLDGDGIIDENDDEEKIAIDRLRAEAQAAADATLRDIDGDGQIDGSEKCMFNVWAVMNSQTEGACVAFENCFHVVCPDGVVQAGW